MSYTKGPWHVGKFNNTQYLKVYATNDDLEMICNIAQDKILHNKVQDFEANAKLITAAPDLLEACQQMIKAFNDAPVEWLQTQGVMDAEIKIRDAIIKAVEQ